MIEYACTAFKTSTRSILIVIIPFFSYAEAVIKARDGHNRNGTVMLLDSDIILPSRARRAIKVHFPTYNVGDISDRAHRPISF